MVCGQRPLHSPKYLLLTSSQLFRETSQQRENKISRLWTSKSGQVCSWCVPRRLKVISSSMNHYCNIHTHALLCPCGPGRATSKTWGHVKSSFSPTQHLSCRELPHFLLPLHLDARTSLFRLGEWDPLCLRGKNADCLLLPYVKALQKEQARQLQPPLGDFSERLQAFDGSRCHFTEMLSLLQGCQITLCRTQTHGVGWEFSN